MSVRFLKIKLKALAAEAKIIRLEEARSHDDLRDKLHSHRVFAVRPEARATQLAYGFLRGRSYSQIEGRALTLPNFGKIQSMVKRYNNTEQGDAALCQALNRWFLEAKLNGVFQVQSMMDEHILTKLEKDWAEAA